MKSNSLSGQTIFSVNGANYLLMDEIGKGGYGKVHNATKLHTDEIVAIKTLHFKSNPKPYFKQQYINRFEQEIKMGTMLHHPNIMQLLDYGYLKNEEPFAVFEYVKGPTLNEFIIQNRFLAPQTVQSIMLQLLDALNEIHAKGIIHCDLKPQNVMLHLNGEQASAKLFDFGGSTFTTPVALNKNTNPSILTTAQYASPEQLRGHTPTLQSDLYSWGLLLLECLTGRPAMQGESIAAIIKKQLGDTEVQMPKGIFSKDLKALLNKVLEKDYHLRIENAAALKAAFSKIDFSKIVIKPDSEIMSIITPAETDTIRIDNR